MKIDSLRFVMLASEDIERSVAFYRDRLCLPLTARFEGFAFFDCFGTTLRLRPLASLNRFTSRLLDEPDRHRRCERHATVLVLWSARDEHPVARTEDIGSISEGDFDLPLDHVPDVTLAAPMGRHIRGVFHQAEDTVTDAVALMTDALHR